MNFLTSIFTSSLIYKGFAILRDIFYQSSLHLYSCLLSTVFVNAYRQSMTHAYLHSNLSFFTPLFSGGLFTSLVSSLFGFVTWLIHVSQNLWKNTMTQKIWTHIQSDCKKNLFGSLATLIYTSLILFSLLTLLIGRGFTRSQMLLLLVTIFLFFGLSQIKGDSEYLENSVIIKWLQKIYL